MKPNKDLAEEKKKEQQLIQKTKESINSNLEQLLVASKNSKQMIFKIKQEGQTLENWKNTLTHNYTQSMADLDLKHSQIFNKISQRDIFSSPHSKASQCSQGQAKREKKEEEIRRQLEIPQRQKLIKLLKYKKEVMGRLLDIKSEGGMYSSHKRVLIKELLETLRKWNEELEHQNERLSLSMNGYEELAAKLDNYNHELEGYRNKEGEKVAQM